MLFGLGKLLRGRPGRTVADAPALAGVLATRSRILAERAITEYTRMRVGPSWPRLFAEAAFQEALGCACRSAAPLALVWLVRVARLAPAEVAGAGPVAHQDAWDRVVASAAARAARDLAPGAHDEAAGTHGGQAVGQATGRAAGLLEDAFARPPAGLSEAVTPCEAACFALMLPLDRAFTDDDRETIRNTLRLLLAEVHEDFARHLDMGALIEAGRRA